ncbi:MAG: oxidoreductase domain protein [Candidatus Sulfotelmatobacter sp.]|nr:oxidoreductase domain protein [Candidatus Sulfotelmatobacter sp.]
MSRNRKPDERIRYAVVGLGHLTQVAVLPAFKTAENSKVVALVSGDPAKRKKIGKKYRIEQTYSYEDYDRALSAVDAVYLVLPNHLHREYAVRAAEAGVHVLCEKPMAITEEDCNAMIDAADANGVKLMVAYRLHFEEGNLEAIRIAESGKLGRLRIFDSAFAQQVVADNVRVTEPVEKGGGPVYDMGVYCINAARYLFQTEPIEVTAFSANDGEKRFQKVDEMTSVVMRFPQERLATFTCSFGAADIGRYTLIGSKGTLTADPAYEYASAMKHQVKIGEKTISKTFRKRDQFAAELIYFSECILKDKEPEPSGWEGLADVRVVRAIYESARTGRAVDLPDFPAKKRPSMRQEIHRPAHAKPRTVKTESPSGEAA